MLHWQRFFEENHTSSDKRKWLQQERLNCNGSHHRHNRNCEYRRKTRKSGVEFQNTKTRVSSSSVRQNEDVRTNLVSNIKTPVHILTQLPPFSAEKVYQAVDECRQKLLQKHIKTLPVHPQRHGLLIAPTFTQGPEYLHQILNNLTEKDPNRTT